MAEDPNKKTKEQEVQNPPASSTISPEEQTLIDSNNQLLEATKESNQATINSVADFIGEYERQKQAKVTEDKDLQKREEAYRYISGLGDTLSGIANLVGVAHGAANQPQKYNSSEIMRKAEEARAKRKQDLENLDQKIKEQRLRLDQVKSAASLQEAQLQAKAEREQLDLKRSLAKEAEEKARYDEGVAWKKSEAERAQANADRTFNAQQAQIKQAQENWQKTYNMQYAKFKEEQKGNKYNFTFADGSFDIPKDKLNEVNVERIFQMLPKELRDSIKGEQYTEIIPADDPMMEPTRKTSYKAPSLAQKLAAIGAYADSDSRIKDELLRLTEDKPKPSTTQQTYTTQSVTQPQSQNTIGANKGGWWYDQYANANQGDYVSDPFAEFN